MFSGIIQAMGTVRKIDDTANDGKQARRLHIAIEAPAVIIRGLRRGASIAVQGICLTVTDRARRRSTFEADVISTTYDSTTIGQWVVGDRVNLESSLSVGAEFGGHIVQGHITGMATVRQIDDDADSGGRIITFAVDNRTARRHRPSRICCHRWCQLNHRPLR